MAVEYIHHSFL